MQKKVILLMSDPVSPSTPAQPKQLLSAPSLIQWNTKKTKRWKAFRDEQHKTAETPICLSDGIFKQAETSAGISLVNLTSLSTFDAGKIYILNSNDIARMGYQRYIDLYLAAPAAHVCIWDFDNHHELKASSIFATFSDFYLPCHPHYNTELSQLTEVMAAPLSAGVIQWSRAFLSENKDLIVQTERTSNPLGRHIFHPQFPERNAMLETLSRHFTDVGYVPSSYHQLDAMDRLQEWCGHMSHWIIPTRNDLPLRVFDALITGGVPILPRSLQGLPALQAFQEHLFYFDPEDLEDPHQITNTANEYFVSSGSEGCLARHRLAMETSHVDQRIQFIVSQVQARSGSGLQ